MESPWIIGGDSNFIVSGEEKLGGLSVTVEECEDSTFCINSCGI